MLGLWVCGCVGDRNHNPDHNHNPPRWSGCVGDLTVNRSQPALHSSQGEGWVGAIVNRNLAVTGFTGSTGLRQVGNRLCETCERTSAGWLRRVDGRNERFAAKQAGQCVHGSNSVFARR